MVGINEFYGWVVSHGGRIETSHPQNWADVSVGEDALAEFIELARQDGMNDAKKNTGYLGETFTFDQGNLYRTLDTENIKAVYVGEEEADHTDKLVEDAFQQVFEAAMLRNDVKYDGLVSEEEEVDHKEYTERMLIEVGKKALFEKCVIDTTPIVEDGEVLDREEWLRKAIWKVPDWLSKDELADLFLLKTDLAARAYKKLRDKSIVGNAHE